MHVSPAVQNLSEQVEHVLTEGVTVQLLSSVEPIDKDGAPEAQKHCEHRFWGDYRASHSRWDFIG
jgi:hypothetical protein